MTNTLFCIISASVVSFASAMTLDTELSNHGEGGWMKYLLEDTRDQCDSAADCRFPATDSSTAYLGPISTETTMFGRVIECGAASEVTVEYDLVSCLEAGSSWETKDKSFAILPGYFGADKTCRGTKVSIGSDTSTLTLTGDTLAEFENECSGTWYTQHYSSSLGNVAANCAQQLEIKNQLNSGTSSGKHLYVSNIQLTCTPNYNTVECMRSGIPVSLDYGFCVSGAGDADGYYKILTTDDAEVIDTTTYGDFVFVRDDDVTSGQEYVYAINNQWVFGSTPGSASTTDLDAACQDTRGYGVPFSTTLDECVLVTPPGSTSPGTIIVGASLSYGEHCDDRVIADSPPFFISFLETVFGNQTNVDIALLFAMCLWWCFLGMITCYGCQWMCYQCKNRKYRRVSNKEVDDIDF